MKAKLMLGVVEKTVELAVNGQEISAQIDGEPTLLTRLPGPDGVVVLQSERGQIFRFVVRGDQVSWRGGQVTVSAARAGRRGGDDAGGLTAPMPGTILQVRVTEGQEVSEGETLLVLEAMKMEHAIKAPQAGRVKRLPFAEGDRCGPGDTLVELDTAG